MTNSLPSSPLPDALDDLTTQLLECGAVLSQLISHMVEFQAAGRSAPDAAPIPEVAQSLIRGVLRDVGKRHSKRDIKVAAAIVKQATASISRDLYYVGPELN
jgi:predicted amidohydrolase